MVITLPFKGRKVKGNQKYRRWERVPYVGSRREEAITEPHKENHSIRTPLTYPLVQSHMNGGENKI